MVKMTGVAFMAATFCASAGGVAVRHDRTTVELGDGVTLEMVWCPPGTFVMGSPEDENGRDDDELQHKVTLTKGFWIGKTEVTQRQWKTVMGTNPSEFKGAGDLPVECVSWEECQAFCRKLKDKLKTGNLKFGNFRLPTEAEWEYACRAGSEMAFCYGAHLDASMANFDGDYPSGWAEERLCCRKTMAVGSFRPNAWGLHDMHGNVCEWCQDWFGGYPSGNSVDPVGAGSGSCRVLRGGGWSDMGAGLCRSASRSRFDPSVQFCILGFRLVCTMP